MTDTLTETPRRIQRLNRKGWKLPPGAIYVGQPTVWGNLFIAGEPPPNWPEGKPFTAQDALDAYVEMLAVGVLLKRPPGRQLVLAAMKVLRGHDLACWCPIGEPCHADHLLLIANA